MKNRAQGAIEYLLIIGAAILVVAIVTGAVMTIIQQGQTQNTEGITKQDTTYTGLKTLTGVTQIVMGQPVALTITEDKELGTFVNLPDNSTITLGTVKYTKTSGTWNSPSTIIPAGSAIIVYAPGSGTINFEATSSTPPQTKIDCTTLGTGIKTIYNTSTSTDQNVYCGASGKMWSKYASTTMTQANAISYCDSLVYANLDDWRLPGCATKMFGSGCELYVYGMDVCGWNGSCGASYLWNGSAYNPITTGSPGNCSSTACTASLTQFDPTSPYSYTWSSQDSTYMGVSLTIVAGRIYYYFPSTTYLRAVRCVR